MNQQPSEPEDLELEDRISPEELERINQEEPWVDIPTDEPVA